MTLQNPGKTLILDPPLHSAPSGHRSQLALFGLKEYSPKYFVIHKKKSQKFLFQIILNYLCEGFHIRKFYFI